MRIDVEQHASALLEFLHDHPDETAETYLQAERIDNENASHVVQQLASQGLVQDVITMGAVDAHITSYGIALVQRHRKDLQRPAKRLGALRTALLEWLDAHPNVSDWSGFLTDETNLHYPGRDFTKDEVMREVVYLLDQGLIKAMSGWQSLVGERMPTITAAGRDCLVDFEGNVSDYINRGSRPSTTTNTTNTVNMIGSTGNITVASENVKQSIQTGFDATAVLKFAGYVRQVIPVLGLDDNDRDNLDERAEALHHEAEAASPNKSKIRELIDDVLAGLRKATATVAQQEAVNLAQLAISALTGS